MRLMTVSFAVLASLAIGTDALAQSGYGGGGGGGNGGFGGEIGGGGQPSLPPPPVWNPADTVRTPALDSTPRTNLPASPSTPSPATALPRGVTNPGTPRAATPRSGLPTARGVPMDFRRDAETLRHFDIDWTFPLTPKSAQPLSWERAVRALAGDDPRPLLVRRHAHAVELGQEARVEALLEQEEMRVVSRFFRCVDLPDATRNEKHPLSGLYVPDRAPLLFFTDADGNAPIGFSGLESSASIVDCAYAVLARNYEGNADRAVKGVRRLIEDYDRLLPRERELAAAVDDAIVEGGTTGKETKKLEQKLARVRKELDEVRASETALTESLKLREKTGDTDR